MNEFLNHIENVKSMLLLETMKLPEDTTPKLRVYIRLPEINIRGLWIFYLACMSKNHIQSHQRNHRKKTSFLQQNTLDV